MSSKVSWSNGPMSQNGTNRVDILNPLTRLGLVRITHQTDRLTLIFKLKIVKIIFFYYIFVKM